MPIDYFDSIKRSVLDPARAFESIEPSDRDFDDLPIGLYVGLAGDVLVIGADDDDDYAVIFQNVASGTFLPIRVRRLCLGTTAGAIVALY
ncbi:hypothetical protein [Xanthobacter autotrophicus]|uniref:spike base protein, RCAP_Rcc01079 family n=1 Tax=Xanthobacter autotrophicus TaxID=280 RepID=UPI003726278B